PPARQRTSAVRPPGREPPGVGGPRDHRLQPAAALRPRGRSRPPHPAGGSARVGDFATPGQGTRAPGRDGRGDTEGRVIPPLPSPPPSGGRERKRCHLASKLRLTKIGRASW